ncbi:YlbF family regulator [Agrilactobacillus fermenti]|uniref:YlbF family regulator n=1 Tax=Agrilactobacillus fermenti TaxID=2586909 RepID=UPI001E3FB5C0|nr:YlbF family regulator [Agrilactobacillus fermenti]MCD2256640.1 YlbF family regulator [Agrilactobacillus fermenti]
MAANIYDTANQLEQELQQTDEFLALQKAFADMKKDDFAFATFKKFQDKQLELQQKQMNGEEFSDEDVQSMQGMSEQLSKFDTINNLMDQERKMSALMDELNRIISKPIADIYKPMQ